MVTAATLNHMSLARARQRGAAVFVVVLVITLLAGLGMFAVSQTSMTMRASGFSRHQTQTHYITDYAMYGAAAYANDLSHALHAVASGGNQDTGCFAYSTLNTANRKQCCKIMSFDEIDARAKQLNNASELIQQPSGSTPGSLGPVGIYADMRIELTDCYEGSAESVGQNLASSEPTQQRVRLQYTFTVTGLVRPPQQTAGTWDTNAAAAAGVEMAQGRVLLPPL